MDNVIIRDFDPKTDFPGVYWTYHSGFHHVDWPSLDEADPDLTIDMLRVVHRAMTKSLVAQVDGEVVGVLMAMAPIRLSPTLLGIAKSVQGQYKFYRNHYNMSRLAKKHHVQFTNGQFKVLLKVPLYRFNHIMLFAVHEKCRGKGLGRKLMDAFVIHARANGGTRATVCTDSCLSWQFYPSYGYDRIHTMPMSAYKYSLPEKFAEGYIYSLDLTKHQIRKDD
jgi:GNAT superfamily N-acetyltransferase